MSDIPGKGHIFQGQSTTMVQYCEIDDEGSDRQGNDNEEERRRIVYEVKAGKVKQLSGGVAAWETTLEKRLTKLGLL